MAPRTDARDTRRPSALVFAIFLVAAAIVPLDFQGHPHWEKVGWIPFISPPIKVADMIGNLLLFVPLGAAAAVNVRPRHGVMVAAITAALLSLAGETLQLYSHVRFPSATDLVCNVLGAVLGASFMLREFRAAAARASLPPRPQTEG